MKAHIVVGLSYGDEGKGIATDYLSKLPNSIVFRFNGGQQAGHGVVDSKGNRHVFANFGSGTLRGVPTYWTKYCTFHPNGFSNERRLLAKKMGLSPQVFLDALAMLTTPYDIVYNQALEKSRNRHGSCGVGFGTTIERNTTPYKLHAQDMLYPEMFQQKLTAIYNYYTRKIDECGNRDVINYWKQYDWNASTKDYLNVVDEVKGDVEIVSEPVFMGHVAIHSENIVFEGAQGVWLDMDFGVFPNVTRSNCTSKNAIELWNRYFRGAAYNEVHINYITRAYLTRHGAGYLSHENFTQFSVASNPKEANVYGEWQQAFRKAPVNFDMINAAIAFDKNFSGDGAVNGVVFRNLFVTCLDHIDKEFLAVSNERIVWGIDSMDKFMSYINHEFNKLYTSYSDCSDNIKSYDVSGGAKTGAPLKMQELEESVFVG